MKMMMLLLVSAVALLVGPAAANTTRHNLNHIIDLADKYNKSLTEQYFVDDVVHLVEDGCKDTFFCKVYDVLHKHKHFGRNEENELVRNLKIITNGINPNCTELLRNVTSTGLKSPIPKILEDLTTCVRRRNTHP